MELIIFLGLAFIALIFLISNGQLTKENKRLKRELKKEKEWKRREPQQNPFGFDFEKANLRNEVHNLRVANQHLRQESEHYKAKFEEMLLHRNRQSQPAYNKEVIEAVRKAMIYSHPDKGNCSTADDFIKYKKIYDEMKRG